MTTWRPLSRALGMALLAGASTADAAWLRHVVDDTSRGADGVRLADVDGDGFPDIATGWEEGGVTRVYLHPGDGDVASPWPGVTVGRTPSVEDAVFCDLDGDGAQDVLSCCEGSTRTLFVHWAPRDRGAYLDPQAWRAEPAPITINATAWMYAVPLQLDGAYGTDIVVGAKGAGAMVGWLQAPVNPRALEAWKLHALRPAGWIMSLVAIDMDHDGDHDILLSDRKGDQTGVWWLENPGARKATAQWPEHAIGAIGREVMFLDATPDAGLVACAVKPDDVFVFRRPANPTQPWPEQVFRMTHPEGIGNAKAAALGDLDLDGRLDVAYSCESAESPRRGLIWFSLPEPGADDPPRTRDISGPDGIKFDRIELVDLDHDGDLDALTCEERHQGRGLGVVWYENPIRP